MLSSSDRKWAWLGTRSEFRRSFWKPLPHGHPKKKVAERGPICWGFILTSQWFGHMLSGWGRSTLSERVYMQAIEQNFPSTVRTSTQVQNVLCCVGQSPNSCHKKNRYATLWLTHPNVCRRTNRSPIAVYTCLHAFFYVKSILSTSPFLITGSSWVNPSC